jgi:hypothetical protein
MGERETRSPAGRGGDRFQTIVAILIAVVSVASAGVIWRASMAVSSAAAADRHGLVDTVQYEAAFAQNVSMLYQEARYAGQHDSYRARVETLRGSDLPGARSEAEWVDQIAGGLALFTPLAGDPAYRTQDGRLDLERRLDDLRAADADLRDLDPQAEFAAADELYVESQVLVSTVIVFAVALFFLTLAEMTRSRARVGLAITGGAMFVLGLVVAAGTEIYVIVSRFVAG